MNLRKLVFYFQVIVTISISIFLGFSMFRVFEYDEYKNVFQILLITNIVTLFLNIILNIKDKDNIINSYNKNNKKIILFIMLTFVLSFFTLLLIFKM